MRIPSTTPPVYAVAPGAACIPPNDLPRTAPAYDEFVVIGAGKTGMHACIWLLENGADPGRIRWIQGTISTGASTLHIDCSAAGIPTQPSTAVFAGDRITIQWVRTCQPAFSAALVGFVESTFTDEELKNRICTPIEPPTVALDWLRMYRIELANRKCWAERSEINDWMEASRLDIFARTARSRLGVDVEATEHIGRYLIYAGPATNKIDELLKDQSL